MSLMTCRCVNRTLFYRQSLREDNITAGDFLHVDEFTLSNTMYCIAKSISQATKLTPPFRRPQSRHNPPLLARPSQRSASQGLAPHPYQFPHGEWMTRHCNSSQEKAIKKRDLPLSRQNPLITEAAGKEATEEFTAKVHSLEHTMIAQALTESRSNITAAAESLSLTRRMLSLKMQKLGISYKQFR